MQTRPDWSLEEELSEPELPSPFLIKRSSMRVESTATALKHHISQSSLKTYLTAYEGEDEPEEVWLDALRLSVFRKGTSEHSLPSLTPTPITSLKPNADPLRGRVPRNVWEQLSAAIRTVERQLQAFGESIDTPKMEGRGRLRCLTDRLACALKVHAGRRSESSHLALPSARIAVFQQYRAADALRQLLNAVADNDCDAMVAALQGGAPSSYMLSSGETPLTTFIKLQSVVHVERAMQLHVDPNARNAAGITPLALAVLTRNRGLVRALLTSEALNCDELVEFTQREGKVDATALMLAAANRLPGVAKLLLEDYKCHPNVVNSAGRSALAFACRYRTRQVVAGLIKMGADVNVVDAFGCTELDWLRGAVWDQKLIDDADYSATLMFGEEWEPTPLFPPLNHWKDDLKQIYKHLISAGVEDGERILDSNAKAGMPHEWWWPKDAFTGALEGVLELPGPHPTLKQQPDSMIPRLTMLSASPVALVMLPLAQAQARRRIAALSSSMKTEKARPKAAARAAVDVQFSCAHCHVSLAAVKCMECQLHYCNACCIEVHRKSSAHTLHRVKVLEQEDEAEGVAGHGGAPAADEVNMRHIQATLREVSQVAVASRQRLASVDSAPPFRHARAVMTPSEAETAACSVLLEADDGSPSGRKLTRYFDSKWSVRYASDLEVEAPSEILAPPTPPPEVTVAPPPLKSRRQSLVLADEPTRRSSVVADLELAASIASSVGVSTMAAVRTLQQRKALDSMPLAGATAIAVAVGAKAAAANISRSMATRRASLAATHDTGKAVDETSPRSLLAVGATASLRRASQVHGLPPAVDSETSATLASSSVVLAGAGEHVPVGASHGRRRRSSLLRTFLDPVHASAVARSHNPDTEASSSWGGSRPQFEINVVGCDGGGGDAGRARVRDGEWKGLEQLPVLSLVSHLAKCNKRKAAGAALADFIQQEESGGLRRPHVIIYCLVLLAKHYAAGNDFIRAAVTFDKAARLLGAYDQRILRDECGIHYACAKADFLNHQGQMVLAQTVLLQWLARISASHNDGPLTLTLIDAVDRQNSLVETKTMALEDTRPAIPGWRERTGETGGSTISPATNAFGERSLTTLVRKRISRRAEAVVVAAAKIQAGARGYLVRTALRTKAGRDWTRATDTDSGQQYFMHLESGEARWTLPAFMHPDAVVCRALCGECVSHGTITAALTFCLHCERTWCPACSEASCQPAGHVGVPMPCAVACGECQQEAGMFACVTCDELYCGACFPAIHAKGARRHHVKHLLPVLEAAYAWLEEHTNASSAVI